MKDVDGCTTLLMASQNEYIDIVKYLIRAHSSVDMQGSDGSTALLTAVQDGHTYTEIIKYLTGNTDVNVQSKDGLTALITAAQNGHLVIVKFLTEANADVNMQG